MVGYWIETIIFMFASIGALLLGFELLSSNVTKLAHTSLKKLFNKTQKNAIIGVGIGALATAIMQSSGATTVMVVGFVYSWLAVIFISRPPLSLPQANLLSSALLSSRYNRTFEPTQLC